MKSMKIMTTALAAAVVLAGSVSAQDPIANAIGARQSLMRLFVYNLGTLGGMAQGKIDYDAASAQRAASNLAKLAAVDSSTMWVAGSDADAVSNTHAKADIWTNGAEFAGNFEKLAAAATAMEAAAGGGLDSLKGAIGAVGGACGGCHKAFRTPMN